MTIVPVGPGQWHVWDKGQRVAVGTDLNGVLVCGYCLRWDCLHVRAILEQDRAEARQADLDAEEGYRELQAMQARGEKMPETEEF